MPSRASVLARDRARTCAISRYVAEHRAALLKQIPDQEKMKKNTRRNELLRLGRKLFLQEPQSTQNKYFTSSGGQVVALSSTSSGGQVVALSSSEASASCAKSERKRVHQSPRPAADLEAPAMCSPPRLPRAELEIESPPRVKLAVTRCPSAKKPKSFPGLVVVPSPVKPDTPLDLRMEVGAGAAVAVGATPPSSGCQVVSELEKALNKQIPWLWRMYGAAGGADILASCYRWIPFAVGLRRRAPRHVSAAAILSLAAKFHDRQLDNDKVTEIWSRVAGKPNLVDVEEVERRIFEAGCVNNLPGEFASERSRSLLSVALP